MREEWTLGVPARLDHVGDVRTFIDSAGLSSTFSCARIFDIKVTASEAVANAIEHAAVDVDVVMRLFADTLVVEVTNEGRFGMGRSRHPSELNRGFGLRLMVTLADEVRFIGGRDGVTKVSLFFLHP